MGLIREAGFEGHVDERIVPSGETFLRPADAEPANVLTHRASHVTAERTRKMRGMDPRFAGQRLVIEMASEADADELENDR